MREEVLSVQEPEANLPIEVWNWYVEYARTTWVGIQKMVYPETGLPADEFRYPLHIQQLADEGVRSDKTSPTDVVFCLVQFVLPKHYSFSNVQMLYT